MTGSDEPADQEVFPGPRSCRVHSAVTPPSRARGPGRQKRRARAPAPSPGWGAVRIRLRWKADWRTGWRRHNAIPRGVRTSPQRGGRGVCCPGVSVCRDSASRCRRLPPAPDLARAGVWHYGARVRAWTPGA